MSRAEWGLPAVSYSEVMVLLLVRCMLQSFWWQTCFKNQQHGWEPIILLQPLDSCINEVPILVSKTVRTHKQKQNMIKWLLVTLCCWKGCVSKKWGMWHTTSICDWSKMITQRVPNLKRRPDIHVLHINNLQNGISKHFLNASFCSADCKWWCFALHNVIFPAAFYQINYYIYGCY